jgi:hypothetical protein
MADVPHKIIFQSMQNSKLADGRPDEERKNRNSSTEKNRLEQENSVMRAKKVNIPAAKQKL